MTVLPLEDVLAFVNGEPYVPRLWDVADETVRQLQIRGLVELVSVSGPDLAECIRPILSDNRRVADLLLTLRGIAILRGPERSGIGRWRLKVSASINAARDALAVA